MRCNASSNPKNYGHYVFCEFDMQLLWVQYRYCGFVYELFFFWFSHPPIKKGKKPLKKFELDSLYLGRKPRVIPRGYLFSCSLLLSWYFKCWSWLMGVVIYNVVRAWEHWEAIVILAFKFSNKWVNGETNNDLLGILRSLRYPSNYKCGGSRDQFTPATSGCYR